MFCVSLGYVSVCVVYELAFVGMCVWHAHVRTHACLSRGQRKTVSCSVTLCSIPLRQGIYLTESGARLKQSSPNNPLVSVLLS